MKKKERSSRHEKITGDFAEHLVLYWLSKRGFECERIDHTGIDLIASKPNKNLRMGISVKGRSRVEGRETTTVSIKKDNFKKVGLACKYFCLKPYFAIVVDADKRRKMYMFILPMKKLKKLHKATKAGRSWKMKDKDIEKYKRDSEIKVVEFDFKQHRWE